MGEFSEQVCIVTGGGRGIGLEVVKMFLAEGATVHSLDVSHPDAIRADNLLQHDCDVTNLAKVGVERSNRFTRSNFSREIKQLKRPPSGGRFAFCSEIPPSYHGTGVETTFASVGNIDGSRV
jgi:NAD(P)-dependent dehydrogenase (short-subunit alcohol dehydrogenase family)